MRKIDPERLRELREQGESARRNMDEVIERVEARRRARRQARERRRAFVRRLNPFRRAA
jgi:hypothetical protein